TLDAAGNIVGGNFDIGTGSNPYVTATVMFDGSKEHTIGETGLGLGGVTASPKGPTTSQGNGRMRSYEILNPPTGTQAWTLVPSTGVGPSPALVVFHSYVGVDIAGTPSGALVAVPVADASAPLETSASVSSATG